MRRTGMSLPSQTYGRRWSGLRFPAGLVGTPVGLRRHRVTPAGGHLEADVAEVLGAPAGGAPSVGVGATCRPGGRRRISAAERRCPTRPRLRPGLRTPAAWTAGRRLPPSAGAADHADHQDQGHREAGHRPAVPPPLGRPASDLPQDRPGRPSPDPAAPRGGRVRRVQSSSALPQLGPQPLQGPVHIRAGGALGAVQDRRDLGERPGRRRTAGPPPPVVAPAGRPAAAGPGRRRPIRSWAGSVID